MGKRNSAIADLRQAASEDTERWTRVGKIFKVVEANPKDAMVRDTAHEILCQWFPDFLVDIEMGGDWRFGEKRPGTLESHKNLIESGDYSEEFLEKVFKELSVKDLVCSEAAKNNGVQSFAIHANEVNDLVHVVHFHNTEKVTIYGFVPVSNTYSENLLIEGDTLTFSQDGKGISKSILESVLKILDKDHLDMETKFNG